jgi:hypothetical protein
MKKLTNTLQVSFVILLTILFASCSTGKYIKGSGKIVTQEKTLGSFTKITNSSSIDTIINYGSEAKVIVSADNNVIEFISLKVTDNTLFVDLKGLNYINTHMKVTITIPTIKSITNERSSDIICSGFSNLTDLSIINEGSGDIELSGKSVNLDITNEGSGDMKLSGKSVNLDIANEGSGDIRASNLEADNCNISNTGSGDLEVFCSSSLNVKNSGSGDFSYKGPAIVGKLVAGPL